MVVAAQGRTFSQAHPDIGDPSRPGCGRRSEARLLDTQRPDSAASNGSEDHRLHREDRAGNGRPRGAASGSPQPPLTDAATAFLQAVRVAFVNFGGFVLDEIRSRRWTSVTFQGARHELDFRLEGEGAEEAAERFLSCLDARNFELRGHLLADVSLVAQERRPGFARIRLDALTVEAR